MGMKHLSGRVSPALRTLSKLLGETNNFSDNKLNINNEIIKSMFLNILEQLDNFRDFNGIN